MFKNHSIFFYFGSFNHLNENLLDDIKKESDVYILEYPFFSINESRELQKKVSEYNTEKKKVFVLKIEKIGLEAEHSLLKVCEEITDFTLIFCFDKGIHILPTLLSRGMVYHEDTLTYHFESIDYDAFVTSSIEERIALYEKYVKKHKDMTDRIVVKYIIEDLLLYQKKEQKEKNNDNKKLLNNAHGLLEGVRTSPKQIYEYICLMLKK